MDVPSGSVAVPKWHKLLTPENVETGKIMLTLRWEKGGIVKSPSLVFE